MLTQIPILSLQVHQSSYALSKLGKILCNGNAHPASNQTGAQTGASFAQQMVTVDCLWQVIKAAYKLSNH